MTSVESWWGRRFRKNFERFSNPQSVIIGDRLHSAGQVGEIDMSDTTISASVADRDATGDDPGRQAFHATLQLAPIGAEQWIALLGELGENIALLSRIIVDELPRDIESLAERVGVTLLPSVPADFVTDCNCGIEIRPCPHVAALVHQTAHELERQPLLIFKLRGLAETTVPNHSKKGPVGWALTALLQQELLPRSPDAAYFEPVLRETSPTTYLEYWSAPSLSFARPVETPSSAVTGIAIKRGGDRPRFWPMRRSFITAMEELYSRVRRHYRDKI